MEFDERTLDSAAADVREIRGHIRSRDDVAVLSLCRCEGLDSDKTYADIKHVGQEF